jgi:hypothetical protein
MAETLLEFHFTIDDPDGRAYRARVCGRPMEDGRWEGWIELQPAGGGAVEVLRSPRETVQPKRADLEYWGTGLTPVYLQGALARAQGIRPRVAAVEMAPPVFDGPAEQPIVIAASTADTAAPAAVLDPFSVYVKGEDLLRQELAALRAWHLRNIVRAYGLAGPESAGDLEALSAPGLIELIVAGVRRRFAETSAAADTEPAPAGAVLP